MRRVGGGDSSEDSDMSPPAQDSRSYAQDTREGGIEGAVSRSQTPPLPSVRRDEHGRRGDLRDVLHGGDRRQAMPPPPPPRRPRPPMQAEVAAPARTDGDVDGGGVRRQGHGRQASRNDDAFAQIMSGLGKIDIDDPGDAQNVLPDLIGLMDRLGVSAHPMVQPQVDALRERLSSIHFQPTQAGAGREQQQEAAFQPQAEPLRNSQPQTQQQQEQPQPRPAMPPRPPTPMEEDRDPPVSELNDDTRTPPVGRTRSTVLPGDDDETMAMPLPEDLPSPPPPTPESGSQAWQTPPRSSHAARYAGDVHGTAARAEPDVGGDGVERGNVEWRGSGLPQNTERPHSPPPPSPSPSSATDSPFTTPVRRQRTSEDTGAFTGSHVPPTPFEESFHFRTPGQPLFTETVGVAPGVATRGRAMPYPPSQPRTRPEWQSQAASSMAGDGGGGSGGGGAGGPHAHDTNFSIGAGVEGSRPGVQLRRRVPGKKIRAGPTPHKSGSPNASSVPARPTSAFYATDSPNRPRPGVNQQQQQQPHMATTGVGGLFSDDATNLPSAAGFTASSTGATGFASTSSGSSAVGAGLWQSVPQPTGAQQGVVGDEAMEGANEGDDGVVFSIGQSPVTKHKPRHGRSPRKPHRAPAQTTSQTTAGAAQPMATDPAQPPPVINVNFPPPPSPPTTANTGFSQTTTSAAMGAAFMPSGGPASPMASPVWATPSGLFGSGPATTTTADADATGPTPASPTPSPPSTQRPSAFGDRTDPAASPLRSAASNACPSVPPTIPSFVFGGASGGGSAVSGGASSPTPSHPMPPPPPPQTSTQPREGVGASAFAGEGSAPVTFSLGKATPPPRKPTHTRHKPTSSTSQTYTSPGTARGVKTSNTAAAAGAAMDTGMASEDEGGSPQGYPYVRHASSSASASGRASASSMFDDDDRRSDGLAGLSEEEDMREEDDVASVRSDGIRMVDTQRERTDAAQGYREKASALYLAKRYEDSFDNFSSAIMVAPDSWVEKFKLYCNRAAALIMLHRYEEAVEDCEKAIEGDPYLLKAYTRCGRAYLHMGQLDRAYFCFDQVQEKAGNMIRDRFDSANPPQPGTRAYHERKSLEEALGEAMDGRAEVQRVEAAIQEAEVHHKRAEWTEALDRVDVALRLAHRAKVAMKIKLVSLCKLKRWEEGFRFCEKFYALSKAELLRLHERNRAGRRYNNNPHSPVNVVTQMGSLEQKNYVKCLRYSDRENEALEALEALQYAHGHVAWCSKELCRIRAIRRAKESGDVAFRERNFDEALEHYADALKLDPEWDLMNAVLHCNRAAAHMALRLFDEAREDCAHALRRKPDYWKAYLRRARALRELKKFTEAISDYETYLRNAGSEPSSASSSSSIPDVRAELDAARREQCREQQRRDRERYQAFRGAFGESSSSSAGGSRWSRSQFRGSRSTAFDGMEGDADFKFDGDEGDPGIFGDYDFYSSRTASSSSGAHTRANAGNASANTNAGASSSGGTRSGGFVGGRGGSNTKPSGGTGGGSSYGGGFRRGFPGFTGSGYSGAGSSSGRGGSTVRGRAMQQTHYTVLGIASAASAADVKKAYHKLALKYHPDKNKDASAEDTFKKISEAYNVLADAQARRLYDADLRLGAFGL